MLAVAVRQFHPEGRQGVAGILGRVHQLHQAGFEGIGRLGPGVAGINDSGDGGGGLLHRQPGILSRGGDGFEAVHDLIERARRDIANLVEHVADVDAGRGGFVRRHLESGQAGGNGIGRGRCVQFTRDHQLGGCGHQFGGGFVVVARGQEGGGGFGHLVGVDAIGQAHALDIVLDLLHAFARIAHLLGDQVHGFLELGGFLDGRPAEGRRQAHHQGIERNDAFGEIGKGRGSRFQIARQVTDAFGQGTDPRPGIINRLENNLNRAA